MQRTWNRIRLAAFPTPSSTRVLTACLVASALAAKLEVDFYEEVEHDEGALGQATTVVVLSAFAAGIGILRVGEMGGLAGLVGGTLARLLAWYVWALYVWAFLTWYIGTRLLPEPQTHADHSQLLRTIGFSSAPGVILHRE